MPIDPEDENKGKGTPATVHNCVNFVPSFRERMDADPQVRELMTFAEMLEGNVRNTGVCTPAA